MRHCADVLAAGFPLVAFLQLVRVYVQSIRRIADAEVRLFHLYVHEPLMREGVPELEMAEEMGELGGRPAAAGRAADGVHPQPLPALLHRAGRGRPHGGRARRARGRGLGRVPMTFCFVDLTGFTRYTEEEGDEEALDVVESFVDTVEATLPSEATIVKTIGDEVMVVSPEPGDADRVGGRLPGSASRSGRSPGSGSTTAPRSTATATTSAATSTSPTGSSRARSAGRCWSPTRWSRRSTSPISCASTQSARSCSRGSRSRSPCIQPGRRWSS